MTAGEWATSATYDEIWTHIRTASRIAVLTHTKVDGDAIGSTLCAARALTLAGKDARPVWAGAFSNRFDFAVRGTPSEKLGETIAPDVFESGWLAGVDGALILDTGAWSQLDEVRPLIERVGERVWVVDHHAHGDPEIAAMRVVDTASASAAQLSARLAAVILGKSSIAELPSDVAEAAYLGLASDTGWFRNSNTGPQALRDAADLIEAGADHNAVRRAIEQGDEPTRLMLMHRVLGTLKFHERDRIATMCVRESDLEGVGATQDDAGGLVDLPSTVRTTRVSVLLSEREDGIIKVSMRSKAGCDDEVDVNAVARKFGGGGHVHAAGAKIEGSLEHVREQIVGAIAEQFA